MFSPDKDTACQKVDLHTYFNIPPHASIECGVCLGRNSRSHALKSYDLPDKQTKWYVCTRCGFAGTGLEYLAACQKVHPAVVLKQLQRKQIIKDVPDSLIHSFKAEYDRIAAILQAYSEQSLFSSQHTSRQLRSLENLQHYFQLSRYRYGSRRDFEKCFHPGLQGTSDSGSRIFRGQHWSNILAIPLYDMPQRISSILFINGHENAKQLTAVRRLGPRHKGNFSYDPGYLAPNMIISPEQMTEPVILSTDWLRVLKFQTDIHYQDRDIAPILGWFPSDPTSQRQWQYRWSFLADVQKIFWSYPGDPVNLREACIQNGAVSYAYYQKDTRACELPEKMLSGAILRSIRKHSVPWYKALIWYLDADTQTAEVRLSELQLPTTVLEQFLPYAPTNLQRFVTKKFFSTAMTSRYVEGVLIGSSQEGWHQISQNPHTPPSLLSSARCLVDRVLCIADAEPMYQGRVLLGEESFPFLEAESIIEKHSSQFVKSVCIDNKSATVPIISVSSSKMFRLIQAHGRFGATHLKSGFGWDDSSNSLVLPNLVVSYGTVFDSEMNLPFGPFSSLTIKHGDELDSVDKQALAMFAEETPYVLAMFASIMPVIFAPAYRMETPQTAVLGTNTELLQQLFQLLVLPVTPTTGSTVAIEKYRQVHRCPYLAKITTKSRAKTKTKKDVWVDTYDFHGYGFIAASLDSVLARMAYGQANLLIPPSKRFYAWLQGKLPDVYRKIFVHCLRHLSKYVLEPAVESMNWNSDLIEETLKYFTKDLGLPVQKSCFHDGYYDSSSYFCDYIMLKQRSEELTISATEKGPISIKVDSLSQCFRKDVGLFDFDTIKTMLTSTGILKDYDPTNHVFLVEAEAFKSSPKRLETIYSLHLRR